MILAMHVILYLILTLKGWITSAKQNAAMECLGYSTHNGQYSNEIQLRPVMRNQGLLVP